MKAKKLISLGAAIFITVTALAGCGEDGGTAEGGKIVLEDVNTAMGRFVESDVTLPQFEEDGGESIQFLIQGREGKLLYTYLEYAEGAGSYSVYEQQEDGTWEKGEAGWLNSIGGGKKIDLRDIRTNAAGDSYAMYFDEEYLAHIVKTTDQTIAEEIAIADLGKKDNLPNGFAVTGDGEIAISYMSGTMADSVVLYNPQDGKVLRSFLQGTAPMDNIRGLIDAKENKLILLSEDKKGFCVYDCDTGEVLDTLKLDVAELGVSIDSGVIKIGKENDYFYLNPKGIHHLQSGGTLTETVVDGSLNTIGIEGMSYSAFVPEAAGEFTILFAEEEGFQLAHYRYDASVPMVPSIQLSMYGLQKNKSVSRAIGTFQKANPDVQIQYDTAQSEEGAITNADSIRVLNTELLSRQGADILLLDGLPVESYIEKGVLTDISDIVNPMLRAGELLENITRGYADEEGHIYGIPARFSMPVLVGDKEINQAFQSLIGLAEYVKANPDREFLTLHHRTITYEELARLLLHSNYQEIIGNGNRPEPEKLAEFLTVVQTAGKAIGATVKEEAKPPVTETELQQIREYRKQHPELISSFAIGDYPVADGQMMGEEIKGLTDMMVPVGLQAQYAREITTVNDLFIPRGMIGINSASKQIETAKAFVQWLLSQEEQEKDMGDGMPVNAKALETYCDKQSEMSIGIGWQEGEHFSFSWPTKEEITDMADRAKTLEIPLNMDRVFEEMIMQEAKAFFEGTISAKEATEAILTKAGTYLAE